MSRASRSLIAMALGTLLGLVSGHAVRAQQGGQMTDAGNPSAADQEVLDVVQAWNGAFARNDAPTYFGYIDADITVLTPSNPYRVEGVADDREEFERGIAAGSGRVGYFQELQPHVQRYGDVAVVTYFSRGAYGPEGKEQTLYLKETDVLVKGPAGWKVVHIHVSSTP
jgi:ketosteroid isomerase-like protein